MKFAICNEIFQGWTIERVLDYCAMLGYDGVEIAPFTLAKTVNEIASETRGRIRAEAERRGLTVCGLHWLLAKTEGLSLTHPDQETRRRTSRYLCDLVDCCADLGGGRLVLGSPQQRQILPGVSVEEGWSFATETVKACVRQAEERGVVICVEPLSRAETSFLNSAGEAIRFAAQFQSPAAKIVLDVKAMCAEGRPLPEIIRDAAGQFAHFHANDKNLKGPGFGAVDFRPIAKALHESAYDGFVSVEVFSFDEGPEIIARRSLEYLRSVF